VTRLSATHFSVTELPQRKFLCQNSLTLIENRTSLLGFLAARVAWKNSVVNPEIAHNLETAETKCVLPLAFDMMT
jgi:hypothetical protein